MSSLDENSFNEWIELEQHFLSKITWRKVKHEKQSKDKENTLYKYKIVC